MSIKLSNLRLPVEQPEAELSTVIADRLGLATEDLARWKILRKSLDARQRHQLQFVYTLAIDLPPELPTTRWQRDNDVTAFAPEVFFDPPPGTDPLHERPIIVGTGPAGLLAGYYLAEKGYRPLLIERGRPVKQRVPTIRRFDAGGAFEREDNYLFGEGGAGCFSDGKLTCRITGSDVDWVLQRFVECGGRESLVYENRPHLGSNKLPMICRNFRRRIEALGGEYQFDCRLESLLIENDRVVGVNTSSGMLRSNAVILAIGHSARDTYETLLSQGVPLLPKAFQLGVRIEQPQEQVNQHKYGKPEYFDVLGAADYTLVAKNRGGKSPKDLFTFCMCAGGLVIPSVSEPEMFCTNGMSNSRHDTSFANSGLVVTLEPHEFGSNHPLAGVAVQRQYEAAAFRAAGGDYGCPISTAADFLAERTPDPQATLDSSYPRGLKPLELRQFLPPVIGHAIAAGLPVMDRKWRGDFLKNATLVGPEMRGSSPVRIDRDRVTRQCPNLPGLFPVGEGAGYAGGIVTAAVDGLRSARVLVEQFAPLE